MTMVGQRWLGVPMAVARAVATAMARGDKGGEKRCGCFGD